MSDVVKLSDFLKASPEVTSLASADCLLAVGPDGETKRIERNVLLSMQRSEYFSGAQWIRLFQYTSAYTLFQMTSNYFSNPGNNIIVNAILSAEDNYFCDIQIMSHLKMGDNNVFSKFRISTNGKRGYLDVYYGSSEKNLVMLSVLPTNSPIVVMLEPNATVSGSDSVKEFDFAAVSGGG